MRIRIRRLVAAGTASLAMAFAPLAFAQGQDNGRGNGGGPSAAEGNGNPSSGNRDNGNPGSGNPGSGNRDNGNANNGNQGGSAASAPGNGNAPTARGGQPPQVDRGRSSRAVERGNGNGVGNNRNAGSRGDRARDGAEVDFALRGLRDAFGIRPRLIEGCPPGLAKKRNGCLPPGQARQAYRSYNPGFFSLFGADRGDYFYNDGYLLRYRGDSLLGYLPLLGGALGIGNVWPDYYEPQPLPAYYTDYYSLGDARSYRYADNVIYRVDPETAAITSVAALLTGDQIEVGQPMPRGYDVYNVPYRYRDRYYDTPQARYRYSDGYVYSIDPETALVASVIDLAI